MLGDRGFLPPYDSALFYGAYAYHHYDRDFSSPNKFYNDDTYRRNDFAAAAAASAASAAVVPDQPSLVAASADVLHSPLVVYPNNAKAGSVDSPDPTGSLCNAAYADDNSCMNSCSSGPKHNPDNTK